MSPKYAIRKIIKGRDPSKLYNSVVKYVNFLWPLSFALSKLPKLGKKINWFLLVADYSELLPGGSSDKLKDWAILDTYDMLSPEYDYPETLSGFLNWHVEENLEKIDVHLGYNGIEGRAIKK